MKNQVFEIGYIVDGNDNCLYRDRFVVKGDDVNSALDQFNNCHPLAENNRIEFIDGIDAESVIGRLNDINKDYSEGGLIFSDEDERTIEYAIALLKVNCIGG